MQSKCSLINKKLFDRQTARSGVEERQEEMATTNNDEALNPLELEQRGVNAPGDDGIVDGEPSGGTDSNYSAPPPKMKAEETGDLTGATSTHSGAGGHMENTGGVGTAPNEVDS